MKKYEVYKNIRKEAVIFGLNIGFFAIFIVSVVMGLFMLIFSFNAILFLLLVAGIIAEYVVLLRLAKNGSLLNFQKVFPSIITNKQKNDLDYEED